MERQILRFLSISLLILASPKAFSLGVVTGASSLKVDQGNIELAGIGSNGSFPNPFIDGDIVISGSNDKNAFNLVNSKSQALLSVLRNVSDPRTTILDIAVTPDRRIFAVSYSDGLVQFYNFDETSKKATLVYSKMMNMSKHRMPLVLSPDGKFLFAQDETRTYGVNGALFKIDSSKAIVTETNLQAGRFLGFSADSKHAFYKLPMIQNRDYKRDPYADMVVRDLEQGIEKFVQHSVDAVRMKVKTLTSSTLQVPSMVGSLSDVQASSADGRYVGFASDRQFIVYDTVASEFLPKTFGTYVSGQHNAFFNSTSRYLVLNMWDKVEVWDTRNWSVTYEGKFRPEPGIHSYRVLRVFDVGDASSDRLLFVKSNSNTSQIHESEVALFDGTNFTAKATVNTGLSLYPVFSTNIAISSNKDRLYYSDLVNGQQGLGVINTRTLENSFRTINSGSSLDVQTIYISGSGDQIAANHKYIERGISNSQPILISLQPGEFSMPRTATFSCGSRLR